jgi:NAD(P)-dependent dehydrogenase (short-subunit alcohol dehydrogenase family)
LDIRFDGQTALISGGSRGIGFACAEMLLDSGAAVAIVGSDGAKMADAEKALSSKGTIRGYQVDVAQVAELPALIERVRQDLGEIDVLVQAAGLMRGGPAEELTEAEWDQVLDVNAKGLFFMMQAVAVQSMIRRQKGAIVNFSSVAGIRGMAEPLCSQHYSASKGAVVQITRQAAVEWAKHGIRANAVAPGGVNTAGRPGGPPAEMMKPIPLGRLTEPWEVAAAVCFLGSGHAANITGQVLVIDGGGSIVGH